MKRAKLILSLISGLVCTACSSPSDQVAEKVSPAWEAIKSGALLVDVRSQGEFDGGHLDGALLVPHTEVKERVAEFGADKARPIVVYCRSGGRSGMAKKTLEKLGYSAVINGGGYEDMKRSKPSE